MALANIITEIAALVAAVDASVKISEYYRFSPDQKSLQDNYVKNSVLKCAIVTRESTAARDRGAGPKNIRNQHVVLIHLFLAVTAAADSERTLQSLAESVRDKLHNNRKLANQAGWLSSPAQVRVFNSVMFAGQILCWHAEITVVAEDQLMGG